MSVGEAEFYAFVKGCCIGLGGISMCRDFGRRYELIIHTDSSAAKGIVGRRGAGKVRGLGNGSSERARNTAVHGGVKKTAAATPNVLYRM